MINPEKNRRRLFGKLILALMTLLVMGSLTTAWAVLIAHGGKTVELDATSKDTKKESPQQGKKSQEKAKTQSSGTAILVKASKPIEATKTESGTKTATATSGTTGIQTTSTIKGTSTISANSSVSGQSGGQTTETKT